MINGILHKLKTSRFEVDVVPSFSSFERNLEYIEEGMDSTLFSLIEEIRKRIENDEHNVEDLACESKW